MNNLILLSTDIRLKNKLCNYIFHNTLYEESTEHILELENIFKIISIELNRELFNLRNEWNNILSLKNVEIIGNKSNLLHLKKQFLPKLVPIIYFMLNNNSEFRNFIENL
jgi:hypothetical protein